MQFKFENLKFEGQFPSRKSAKNNNGQKRPLLEVQIEKSFQLFFFQKNAILGSKIWKKLKVQKWCQNGSNSII